MKNYIGIDQSLTSTAISIVSNKGEFIISFIKDYKPSKWTKILDFEPHNVTYKSVKKYSESELSKLYDVDQLTNNIMVQIEPKIDLSEETFIGIEGYSYGSGVGKLIDLVRLGEMLRKKLVERFGYGNLIILSPKTLKADSCKLAYGTDEKGKNNKNPLGISGGSFTKREMFNAIIDSELDDKHAKWCRIYKDKILEIKSIPKPLDDINDAYLCSHVIKKFYI
jgi:hypothetical protein